MAQTKTITVTLQVKELIYDIQNKSYYAGQAREADGSKTYEGASYIQLSDDEENGYQIRRSLTNTFTALKTLLGEYLVENKMTSSNTIVKYIDNDTQLNFEFKMPANFNEASADSLGNNIHSYMVDMALGDWFSITNQNDAKIYYDHAELSLDSVRRALYKRSRPSRPKY
jgi:hypothetical protein